MSARLGVFGAAVSALLVYGFSSPAASVAPAAKDAAATASARVDNFLLVDANFEAHELYRLGEFKAVVLVTQANGDAVMRSQAPALKALKAAYAAKGVEFMMLNSNLKDSREAILAEMTKAGYDTPVLMDSYQLVGEGLGVTRSAEVIVIDPKTWGVAYRGALSDPATAKALEALTAGHPVMATQASASNGAMIDFPARAKKMQITYVKDVAPILEAKCTACHSEGGIGPFAMKDYATVKGFSPMIRETIRTDRMPPFHSDPHVGKFSNDRRLTPDETKTLVHWIDQGAVRGEGADPLGVKHIVAVEWPLGKPDVVLDVPSYTIPATGVVDYQHPWVNNPLTAGRWLKASTIKVDSRQAVHHILTGFMDEAPKAGQPAFENRWGASVGSYAVGAESEVAPTDAGTYIPPGGAIGFQNHYTPFGKEVVTHSKIGLYFYKAGEVPDIVMHNNQIVNNAIVLPPYDGHHQEVAYMEFPKDALLYSAFPHAHYRATSSDLWIRYPDGKEKLLLTLPRYDFGWQGHYNFAEPIKIPAGSKLIAHYVYDNSKSNPHNPDPSKTVVWGDQSFEEMFFTRIRYRWMEETSKHLVNYDQDIGQGMLMGMLDSNIDGKIQKSELKPQSQIGGMLLKNWDALDKNHDGVIDKDELAVAMKMMGGRRRQETASAAPAAPKAAAASASTPAAGGK
ncbi:hypothetical protein [Phenylobacterium sp.]|uniref:hypothetical protein n=1 Tax=Phenylobacterium sp. TaxID=1871053 RepID=UPI00374DF306